MHIQEKIIDSGQKGPTVCVVGCLHGDELVGKKIMEQVNKLKPKIGKIITIIGNPKAVKKNVRFIEQDLNRSFPGNKSGSYEEILAYQIKKITDDADIVVDLHSTTSTVEDLVIITKINKSMVKILGFFNPKRVILMKKSISKKALIHYCKLGISFEYGKDESLSAHNKTLRDLLAILQNVGMLDRKIDMRKKLKKSEYYKITGVVKKEVDMKLDRAIDNFKLVKKGDALLKSSGKRIAARRDFYPVLFREEAYKAIFGFVADKIEV